jgi:heme-degrading monooxygenase HmoA
MPFFVAIHQEAWPERLESLLATIRGNLAASRILHPGRQGTRLFQRIGQPTHLLSISEWDAEEHFERFRHSAVFVETNAVSGPSLRIEPLERLRLLQRMDRRAVVVACATVTAPPERAAEVEAVLLSEEHRAVERADGLIFREVFRSRAVVGHLLLVHGWASLAHLDRFRASESLRGEAALLQLGATTERFTGEIAAEYSSFHEPADA